MEQMTGVIYPPRPEKAVSPDFIQFYENRGWVSQVKKNGTCSVAVVSPDGEVEYWTRHGEKHRAWQPDEKHPVSRVFECFPDTTFVFELLHSKGGHVRDTAYVFDVVRWLGQDLVGFYLSDRLQLLEELKKVPSITGQVVVAETRRQGHRALFDSLTDVLDEGIVLKDPASILRPCYRDGLNASWQVKCRCPTKNYAF